MATVQTGKAGIATAKRGQTGKEKVAAAKFGKAGDAVTNGKEEVVTKAKKPVTAVVIPTVSAKAMSKDVGPRVALGMAQVAETEAEAKKLLAGVDSKRYDLLAQLTQAIVKAANNDKGIDLSKTFSGDLKEVNMLNDKLGIALGFREVVTIGEGDKARERVVTAKALEQIWPRQGETANNSPEYKRKSTVRSNFLHALKKCAQAAEGIRSKDLKVSLDKESGTLRLSGPNIKSTFGEDSVLLNEKQTIGEGDKAVKLLAKPSYTSIANMGAEAHGKVLKTRVQSGIGHAGSSGVDPVTAFVSVCSALVKGIEKLGAKPDAKCVDALRSVQNAIAKTGLVE
jgi:hypothetical protein